MVPSTSGLDDLEHNPPLGVEFAATQNVSVTLPDVRALGGVVNYTF